MKKTALALSALLMLGACATHPNDIQAAYVSPMMYANFTCAQLVEENARVQSRVVQVTATQRRRANNDKTAAAVGIILFAPALFFMANGDQADELARLKGEYDAIQQAGTQKGCSLPTTQAAAAAA